MSYKLDESLTSIIHGSSDILVVAARPMNHEMTGKFYKLVVTGVESCYSNRGELATTGTGNVGDLLLEDRWQSEEEHKQEHPLHTQQSVWKVCSQTSLLVMKQENSGVQNIC